LSTKGPRIRGLLAARKTADVAPDAVEPAEVQAPAANEPVEVGHAEDAVGDAQDSSGEDDVLPTHVGGNLVLVIQQTLRIAEAVVGLEHHRLLPHSRSANRRFALVEEPDEFQVADLEVRRRDVLHDLLAPVGDEIRGVDLAGLERELQLAHHEHPDLALDDLVEDPLYILVITTSFMYRFRHQPTDVVQLPPVSQNVTLSSHDNTS